MVETPFENKAQSGMYPSNANGAGIRQPGAQRSEALGCDWNEIKP